jgi:hypothetical protein
MTRRFFRQLSLFATALALSGPALAAAGHPRLPTGALPGDVVTHHVDNLRTGWDQSETTLTPANVGGGNFGLLAQVALDEQVDAQPLFLGGQAIANQGNHDVVYVATENDTVYAIDAQSGATLLSNHLGTPVPISVLPGQCNNNSNNMGINSTPVIDRAAGLIYVMTYTYEHDTPVFRLHALSLSTLTDTLPSVVVRAESDYRNGRTARFVAANNRQRAALLETSGNIYAGFASWCDINANVSRGWVLGWNATTLSALPAAKLFNQRPKSPDDFFLSSVWMSGYGIASDDNGSLFLITGNSDYSGTTYNDTYNLAESVIRLSSDLTTVQGFFTPKTGPDNWKQLDYYDNDFGSAGVLLLPAQAGGTPDMAVAAGKAGPMYLLDRDNLGGLVNPAKTLGQYANYGCWCGQSYYVGADGVGRVVESTGSIVVVWTVQTSPASLALESVSQNLNSGQDPGFFTTVSSNGTQAGSAVVWAVSRPTDTDPADVYLQAFDPANGAALLFGGVAGTWPFAGNANANLVPVVGNGHVFVASYGNLSIFGLAANGARHAVFKAPPRPVPFADPRAPHALTGVVTAVRDGSFTLRKRDGSLVAVDDAAAEKAFHVAPPALGRASLVRGAYGKDDAFVAAYVLHQKQSVKLWPADR